MTSRDARARGTCGAGILCTVYRSADPSTAQLHDPFCQCSASAIVIGLRLCGTTYNTGMLITIIMSLKIYPARASESAS